MPTWLRRFTFIKIKTYYDEQSESLENQSKGGKQTVINSDGTIKTPELLQKAANSKKPIKYG
jgi:hypothetical protein